MHEERIKARIADLKEERAARLELLSQNRKELASQFARIRQTVEKILDEDLNLREKLKLVFREHHHCRIDLNRLDNLDNRHDSHRWCWSWWISESAKATQQG